MTPEGKSTVTISLYDEIGLPSYSKVGVGPVTLSRVVDDTPEARKKAAEELTDEVKDILGHLREVTLDAVKAFAKSGGYGDARQ
jgi:hypothetical protein